MNVLLARCDNWPSKDVPRLVYVFFPYGGSRDCSVIGRILGPGLGCSHCSPDPISVPPRLAQHYRHL